LKANAHAAAQTLAAEARWERRNTMAATTETQSVPRVGVEDLKEWVDAGRPATILDARGSQAWDSTNVKIRGAIRVDPKAFRVDPAWPKDQMTVVY
jgi:hypothetical protein